MSIAIFINTKAGGGKGKTILPLIEAFLKEHKVKYRIYLDDWCSIENLNSYINVWLVGGDGTLNYFINKFLNIEIPIGVIKAGTGNDFAWKLYGNISLDVQLELLLKNNIIEVDVGNCNNIYFLNGVGVGFDGEILKSMSKIRWLGGHLGYLLIVIKKIFTFKEKIFTLVINKKEFKEKFLLMSIFNSSRTGGGFHIAPTAKINDGFLDVILCKPLSIFKRLVNLPKIEKGNHLSLPFIHHHLIKNILINCSSNTAAQIDGELFWAENFKISIAEKKLKFLV